MLRSILMLGFLVVVGMFAAGLVFNVLGGILGLVIWVCIVAVKLLIVGGLLYLGVRIVSPGTTQRLKERFHARLPSRCGGRFPPQVRVPSAARTRSGVIGKLIHAAHYGDS